MLWKPYIFLKIIGPLSFSVLPLYPVEVNGILHGNLMTEYSGPTPNQTLAGAHSDPDGVAIQIKVKFS